MEDILQGRIAKYNGEDIGFAIKTMNTATFYQNGLELIQRFLVNKYNVLKYPKQN